MNLKDKIRVMRYRKAFPMDKRTPEAILEELNEQRDAKRKMNKWFERMSKAY